ncbi:MAG: GNAT family N-acetyltransferase [Sphingomonas sp.]|uniref:GNAT family N-acetyltransferase n=1 Tax=Sphingomonas sp. TaxID=28214 RepID=UPI0012011AD4|nr:GNAT family N-acetyltransferase [Sphingomonas sp.]THD37807.1 MAG: GNAT family N-acetyltransferase [Sphingomonas sp.]
MSELTFRDATDADLPAIIALLAEDQIGGRKDDPGPPLDPVYAAAFAAIDGDANQRLIVAEIHGAVIGTMQLSFLPGLLNRGAWRGQIEAVRIAANQRSKGRGETMIAWAVEQCRARGCFMAQLTSNNDRVRAHAFYERLGWQKSHAGFKLYLTEVH